MGYQSDLSLTRRAALSIAAAVPVAPALAAGSTLPDRDTWDRACHEYRRLKLLMDAYYALGPLNWANEEYSRAKRWEGTGSKRYELADQHLRREEDEQDQYYKPVDAAALTLMQIPAPDLNAVALKIKLHDKHLAGTDDEQVAWRFIADDLRRLAL